MTSAYYDPESAPDPNEWLALPEGERIRLVRSYHVARKLRAPSMKAHAALHVVIENQLASGYGPSKRAVARLLSDGLSRHDALHAIASVVTQFIYESTQGQTETQRMTFQARLNEAIERLESDGWKATGDK